MTHSGISRSAVYWACWTLLVAGGCSQKRDVVGQVARGEYGRARQVLAEDLQQDKGNREYMYDRMVLAMVDLADGQPRAADPAVEEVFTILNTRGINDDKTVAAVVTWEGVKFWKGEPFEQAMMLSYIALQKASLGRWDDARSAALNSLFWLKDFGSGEGGTSKTAEQVAREAVEYEQENEPQSEGDDYLSSGYQAARTNFALGYLLAGASNAVLGQADPDRQAEAAEHFASARAIDPELESVIDRLQRGDYNTLLVVDYGLGPSKVSYGMDNVFAKFVPRGQWPSGRERLRVSVNDGQAADFAAACDVNFMATDLKWNNTEDVRQAKSHLGTALLAGGAAAAAFGNDDMQVAGLVMGLVGAYSKATAAADTTHCTIMPQRVYVAPVTISAPDSTVQLQVGGYADSRLILAGLDPPQGVDGVQLRYVRIPPSRAGQPWAASGQVLYANDHHAGRVPGDDLPYILGGRCVRRPSHEALDRYQRGGRLPGMTLDELQGLYREEGILLDLAESEAMEQGRHVLEGGTSLACPLPGTAGYARLFGQEHAPYLPKSDMVREWHSRLRDPGS